MYCALDPLGKVYFTQDSENKSTTTKYYDMRRGEWTVSGSKIDLEDIIDLPKRPQPIVLDWMDTEVVWLLGLYYVYGKANYRPYFGQRPWELIISTPQSLPKWNVWIERAKLTLLRLGASRVVVVKGQLYCYDKSVVQLFINMFYDNVHVLANKTVPRLLLNSSQEVSRMFVDAILQVVHGPLFFESESCFFGFVYLANLLGNPKNMFIDKQRRCVCV